MTWKKVKEPRDQLITIRFTRRELIQIILLSKRENISKQEAARRLSFPAEEGA